MQRAGRISLLAIKHTNEVKDHELIPGSRCGARMEV